MFSVQTRVRRRRRLAQPSLGLRVYNPVRNAVRRNCHSDRTVRLNGAGPPLRVRYSCLPKGS